MQVFVLEIKYSYPEYTEVLFPVLLQHNHELVLVDCGYAGSLPLLQKAASLQGLSLNNLTGILLTHHDIDHTGGLQELKTAYPNAKVYAPALEAPYISGEAKSLRLQQAEALYDTLPEAQKAGARQFQESLQAVKPVPVDVRLAANEVPASWGDVQLIPTPGHMPGHISVYLPKNKTLIAADALVVENNEMELANPAFTLNLEQAITSVQKLQQLQPERIICYHGGIVEEAISEKLQKLITKYKPAQPTQQPAQSENQELRSPACYAHLKDFREGF
ncbi:MBL fold metallo-hydrolase [Pontibacter sp. H259]|uniref:MBL fold metallo-hydrolase n=1 Tax=Pontibacter sp. H259 TaxID=3133421 RepID=UPI0030BF812D